MWTMSYWKQLAEEAVKGFVVGAGTILAGAGVNAFEADWNEALGLGLGGAVAAVIYGLSVRNIGTPNTASPVREDKPVAEA